VVQTRWGVEGCQIRMACRAFEHAGPSRLVRRRGHDLDFIRVEFVARDRFG